jgi:carbohydrate-selective porin OprB
MRNNYVQKKTLLGLLFLLVIIEVCSAEHADDVRNSDTLTGGLGGLNDLLKNNGIEMGLGITNIYQANVKGGLSTRNRRGRYSGSYDLELTGDTQKLFGIEGGSLYVHGEGWWSKSGGIDEASVGSVFAVNGDAGSRDALVMTEFWWEQSMLDGTLRLRLGKLDMTGGFEHHGCPVSFDCSNYANDETSQFLNSALINNPTIPFPDCGLGALLYWNPIKWWYASIGVADAQADARETGFSTTFGGEDYFFYIFETGVTSRLDSSKGPLQGAYRIGFWNDPQPKANEDSVKSYRDDIGVYANFDQMLYKENSESVDSQGLGAFFRYGFAPSKRNDITNFYSFGFQYQGIIDDRDDDVLGIGFAQGIFSDSANTTFVEDYENAIELYYNVKVADWFNVSPSIQYISNPGGNDAVSDSVVLGLRAQMNF